MTFKAYNYKLLDKLRQLKTTMKKRRRKKRNEEFLLKKFNRRGNVKRSRVIIKPNP